jgi:hypothetical protein
LLGLDEYGGVDPTSVSVSSRLLVSSRCRGTEVAGRLIDELCRFARARGVRRDFTVCRPALLDLFLALGYRQYKPAVEHPDAGEVVPLVIDLAENGGPLRRPG